MKKFLSLPLVLVLILSLGAPALAAEAVTPTPPAWCPAEEYAVFENSTAYEPETWEKLLSLRRHAEAGGSAPTSSGETVLFNSLRALEKSKDPGVLFELSLISVKMAMNAAAQGQAVQVFGNFDMAAYYAGGQEPQTYLCRLWNARCNLRYRDVAAGLAGRDLGFYVGAVEPLLAYPGFTLADIYDCPLLAGLPSEQMSAAKALIFVTLDGEIVHPRAVRYDANHVDTSTAQVRNQHTMVPVRRLAELMGAVVSYDGDTRQVTIQRAGDTIVMTLDSKEALQNGVPFQMDVAPYAENSRTYIPIRYIAEFFGQKVDWNGAQQHVVITEDKSVAGDSNLEAWALAMGALVMDENNAKESHLFGGISRFGVDPVGSPVSNRLESTGPDYGRTTLSQGWAITDREGLMFTATALAEGACAWDWFRSGCLVQWGYLAGYVTYPEALELVEPAARKVQSAYGGWDEAVEEYLNGWMAWDGKTGDVWQTTRGQRYQELKSSGAFFNDALFQTGVIGLPE